MRLLVDTDAFCKLAAAGLLEAAVASLGMSMSDCGRLAALPYMLRRGRLRTRLGDALADTLLPVAAGMSEVPAPPSLWYERLVNVQDIDAGEAQLIALATEGSAKLLTGDKRALKAARSIGGLATLLDRTVILPEAVLLALCRKHGHDTIRQAFASTKHLDVMLEVCFSETNPTPVNSLLSYVRNARTELSPIELWLPEEADGEPQ